jgi:hypothetical protein
MQLKSMRDTGLLPQAGSEEERAVLQPRAGDAAGAKSVAVEDVLDPKMVSKTKFHSLLKTFKQDGEEPPTRPTLPPLQNQHGVADRNIVTTFSDSQGMRRGALLPGVLNTTQTGRTASTHPVGMLESSGTASVLGSRTGTQGPGLSNDIESGDM